MLAHQRRRHLGVAAGMPRRPPGCASCCSCLRRWPTRSTASAAPSVTPCSSGWPRTSPWCRPSTCARVGPARGAWPACGRRPRERGRSRLTLGPVAVFPGDEHVGYLEGAPARPPAEAPCWSIWPAAPPSAPLDRPAEHDFVPHVTLTQGIDEVTAGLGGGRVQPSWARRAGRGSTVPPPARGAASGSTGRRWRPIADVGSGPRPTSWAEVAWSSSSRPAEHLVDPQADGPRWTSGRRWTRSPARIAMTCPDGGPAEGDRWWWWLATPRSGGRAWLAEVGLGSDGAVARRRLARRSRRCRSRRRRPPDPGGRVGRWPRPGAA